MRSPLQSVLYTPCCIGRLYLHRGRYPRRWRVELGFMRGLCLVRNAAACENEVYEAEKRIDDIGYWHCLTHSSRPPYECFSPLDTRERVHT